MRFIPNKGGYCIRNVAFGTNIDVQESSKDNSSHIGGWTPNAHDNQRVEVKFYKGKLTSFVFAHSGKCIDTPSKEEGTKVHQ